MKLLKSIKALLFGSLMFSILPSQAMVARSARTIVAASRPAIKTAFRTVQTPVVTHTTPLVATQLSRFAIARQLATYVRPLGMQSSATYATTTRPTKHNYYNYNAHSTNRYRSCLAGLGATASALYVGTQLAKSEEKEQSKQENERYIPPFETQRLKYYEDLKAKPWGKVAEKYIKQLEDEEKALMQEFFQMAGITENEWQNYLKRFFYSADLNEYENKKYIPKELISLISDLLQEVYIDPATIKILCRNQLSSVQTAIFTDKVVYQKFETNDHELAHYIWQENTLEAIILHEIQHILHNDSFNATTFDWLDHKTIRYPVNIKTYNNFVLRFRKLQEKRADLMAGLHHPKYAKGVSVYHLSNPIRGWWVEMLSLLFNDEHDTDFNRAAYMNQLHQEMLAAIEHNKKSL